MRVWLTSFIVLFLAVNSANAQRKQNKMNGLSEMNTTKKKYNKQWMKMKKTGLPSFSTTVGICAGPSTISHGESQIEQFGNAMLFAPELVFNINPSKNLGFNLGLSYRSLNYSYYTTNASFTNDTLAATANGDWKQNFGNVGISIGFTYYASIAKTISNCTGFGRVQGSSAHLFIDNGITFAPTLFNEVFFRGNYNTFVNGEPRDQAVNSDYLIMYNEQSRRDPMLFYYAKLGLRFQGEGYATRIGGFFNYQLNSNSGLVNDFTSSKSSISVIGVNFGFEFF